MLVGCEQPGGPQQDQYDKRNGIAPVVKDRLAPRAMIYSPVCPLNRGRRSLPHADLVAGRTPGWRLSNDAGPETHSAVRDSIQAPPGWAPVLAAILYGPLKPCGGFFQIGRKDGEIAPSAYPLLTFVRQPAGRFIALCCKPLAILVKNGAACVTRTRDPIITNDVLYRLS